VPGTGGCRVGVVRGPDLLRYSFPAPHPFNSARAEAFWKELDGARLRVVGLRPERADEATLRLFHTGEHVESVKEASALGAGFLDGGDTPAYPGVMEASEYVVGSTLECVRKVLSGELDHAFNPVGGLHHARRGASAGFCVFNDIGVSIEYLRGEGVRRVLYVDIDVHHGDGVFYPYEADAGVLIFDVHEDGRFLYPGTGDERESGAGPAVGTKVNVPLRPGSGDEVLPTIGTKLSDFASRFSPEFVLFQCGADGLAGDPLGGLNFSEGLHRSVARILHGISHQKCGGRMVALGGGGYLLENCARGWMAVVEELAKSPPE
jgi:acetoin utilization protein AcuC